MSSNDEYYIILHVGGHFVNDPYVRYVKFKEIKLYVEHEVDNPTIVDDIFLLTTGEGDDEGVESDGEDDLEKVESSGKGDVGEVQADREGVSATGIEVDKDIGMESGGHISLGFAVGKDNDSEVAGNEYAGDFAASDGVDNVADKYVGDFATSDGVDNVANEYAGDFATSDGLDNVTAARSGEEDDGNETKVWDSDEHGSLVESDEDEEHEDGERRRSKFPLHNDKLKFSLGMLFKDGKQFKSAIRKYSKECRRQLKFIKNKPKRVVVRCIASPNCPWRIRASYSPVAKCLQIKTFQDEHHCSVSFKNKMVTATMIAQHFEANIKHHPKMKLREIQRRCASEMHVNVTIDCCYRVKKIVSEKMAGNHKDEFGLLWDYAHELRSKMPGSTIRMAVQRVTVDSLPHFKRFYVCFGVLKRGWKVGCRPLIGLDGCFLKGPFRSDFLTVVGRDANNQMFPIAWAMVEVECTNSWGWFLSLLSTDLGLEDGYGYTIISDQQKGLEIAISDILPRVEHSNCARHVFANWSGRKLGKSYKCDFWQIVKCMTEREWGDLCSTLEKKDKDVYNNLIKKSPKMWTRAFFGTTCKSDIVDNNLCEAFNSSIVEARFKSIIRMLEDIRTKMMTRIVQKRKLCNRWKQNYGPLVKVKFDANKKDYVE
ncbi:hypothetical protein PVK06_010511 [Gossypium arboreum]|uniref:Uncharacterized protein n=1 Tax=Gossypium arboreum TaxID=29729 RepID=A0ABR0Q7F9_GOSAR|nr:hypothetical protein PVK06_010511 [Gossypium arboreum]